MHILQHTSTYARSTSSTEYPYLESQFHKSKQEWTPKHWPSVDSATPNFNPTGAGMGVRAPETKNFRISESKVPTGAYPLHDFNEIFRVCGSSPLINHSDLEIHSGVLQSRGLNLSGWIFFQIFRNSMDLLCHHAKYGEAWTLCTA